MLRRNGLNAMVAVLVALALPIVVQAEVLTWAMEGTIQQVVDPLGLIGYAQQDGSARYSFSFDTDATNTYPEPTAGIYSGISSSLLVGDRLFSMDPPTITVLPNSWFEVQSWGYVDGMKTSTYFRLYDSAGNLSNISLPHDPYPLNIFGWTDFSCSFQGPPSYNNPTYTLLSVSGPIVSFTPEPSSFLLLLPSGVCLLRRRRTK